MLPSWFLPRMLIATVLGAAAMLLAATGAEAHAGHDHAKHAAAAIHHASLDAAEYAAAPGHGTMAVPVAKTRAVAMAGRRIEGATQSSEPCIGGCCHGGAAGCCGAWLPTAMKLSLPAHARFEFALLAFGGTGITPEALPEPPKSLA
jgi:hypothetical protein